MDNKLINEIISLAENGGARGNDITAVYSFSLCWKSGSI